jgi:hypothetical protein
MKDQPAHIELGMDAPAKAHGSISIPNVAAPIASKVVSRHFGFAIVAGTVQKIMGGGG